MKLRLPLFTCFFLIAQFSSGQLPNGSTAPNWTMTDLNGVSHTLYDYLNNGKVVFLDFSATWCLPCWNYHNSNAMKNLYNQYGPPGSNNVMVFMIETDPSTNTACLYGPTGCVGGTQGDWVTGTPYPIINNSSQSGPYAINYYPTIYGICQDKKITEVGQMGTAQLWGFAQNCTLSPPNAAIVGVTNVGCYGGSTGAVTLSVTGGVPPFTYQWNNGATTQNLSNVPAGTYAVTVTASNGGTVSAGPANVSQPSSAVSSSLLFTLPAGCNGVGGYAQAAASGGTPAYSWLWSNGATTSLASNLSAGSYSVTATDNNGCTSSLGNIIVDPPVLPSASIAAPQSLNCNNTSVFLDGTSSTTGPNMSYNWTTANGHIVSGNGGLTILVDQPGTYQLRVTNTGNTCSATAAVTVQQNVTPPTASAGSGGQINCTTPSLTLNGSGSTGASFSYLWTTTGGNIVSGATTLTPVVNAAGTYKLTVSNTTNGCTASSTTTVTANTAIPNVSATGGQLSCNNTSVQLAGNSTTNGVTYAWAGPNGYTSIEQNPTVTAAGNYTLTVTNGSNGCTASATAVVSQNNTPPQASATGGTLNCLNASVTLNGSSTTPGVTYAWTGPGGFTFNGQNPEVSVAGNYALTVSAPNGCTSTTTAIVNQNITLPVANAGPAGVLNCHANSLVLNGAGSSGGSQFVYEWTTLNGNIVSGANTLTPTVNAAGNYQLMVTNNNSGCTGSASTQVTQSLPVTAEISSQTNISCFGNASGSATVAANGGNGTFTYAWSNGSNTTTASNLSAGTYTVTVTDGENCAATKTAVITQPAALVLTASATAQTTPGVNDGNASANSTGGYGNYTYAWSNGETTAIINDLSPGNYAVTVTDANGCTKSKTVTVNVFGCAVQIETSNEDATCNGATDGTASVILTNAAEPYTFVWSNGETTQSVSGLAAGAYTVTAEDDNGCEVVASVSIGEPAVLTANATSTGLTAANANDGTATANPTGGTGPYTFLWSNDETTATITSLASANYMVTVTDANGCEAVQTVPIAPFGCSLLPDITFNHISCNGANDGQATITLTGGLSPYAYEWSNEAVSATISGLAPGTYTVTVTDVVNCPAIAEVTINEPATLQAAITELSDTDCGINNGMATVIGMGGTQAYTFVWSNGETSASATNLAAGSYTVSVTDANDCQTSIEVEIAIDDAEAPVVVTQNITVALNANGLASITAEQVNNGSSDNCTIASMKLDAGSYGCNDLGEHEVTLTVTDEAGNSSIGIATITVVDNTAPVVQVKNITLVLDENGKAALTPEMLENGSTDNCGITSMSIDVAAFDCSQIGDNAVVLTVMDASGNSASGTAIVTIKDETAPVINCPGNKVLPFCEAVLEFGITASDNCTPNLVPNQTSGLPTGSAFPGGLTVNTFKVSDASGNSAACSFTVTVSEAMFIGIEQQNVSCFGKKDGSISAEASGGNPGYTYLWSNGATTATTSSLASGTYTVTVTDNAGCTGVESATVTQPAVIQSTVISIVSETNSQQNGAIDVSVSGGTPPYSFVWKNAAGAVISTEEDVQGLSAGNYQFQVTDANGCISLNTYTIQAVTAVVEPALENRIGLFPNPTNGMITLQLKGLQVSQLAIEVFDVTGKTITSYPAAEVTHGKSELDLTAQPAGVYFVKILVENQVVTKRVVVNR